MSSRHRSIFETGIWWESHLHAEWLAASGGGVSISYPRQPRHVEFGTPAAFAYIAEAIKSAEASRRAASCIEAVLAALEDDFAGDPPYWYSGREAFAHSLIERAPIDFDRSFDRWRDLLAAAERAVELATQTLDDYSISPRERKASESRLAMGNW